jgi:pilus assembly protein Flp/PilA
MEWSTRNNGACAVSPTRILDKTVPRTVLGNNREASPEASWLHLLWTGKGFVMVSRFSQALANFLKGEDGPTAVEYAVMLALIIVVCIAAITALGTNANATFTSVSNTVGSTSS